ncbi:MAG: class I SAM-dependent methyltransferase [Coriobacteriaceae bacterium]|nr:class I SAM-dependent methyltransferase [Coriobacteriaceae bacterium]
MDAGSYTDANAAAIGRWIDEGWEWGTPIDHETYRRAVDGDWQVLLTPTRPVPRAWFGDLEGTRVLGLASGGGQQCPIFAAAGAKVTVLDYTPAQLESERLVAEREGYPIACVRADMTKPLPFPDGSFDIVFNPVSLCYVREVEPIWREVSRVLVPGGVLLTGFDTVINYIVDGDEERIGWSLPFDPLVNPEQAAFLAEDDAGMQFSHTLDEMLGGLLRAGFSIDGLYEDTNGEGRLHELHIPTYLAVRAVKR